jgi:phage terminase small subunit
MAEDKLTPKQEAFIREYIKNGGNATQAAKKVYNCKNEGSARVIGWENLTKLNTQDLRKKLMEAHGLTDGKIFSKLIEQMDACKVISANIYMKKGEDPEEEMKEAGGCTKDFIDVPDNQAQLKAVEIAAKIKGMFNQMDDEEQTVPVKLVFEVPKDWRPKKA